MSAARDRTPAEAEIYKVDTVPPPAGEDSAYDAVTKVGPMARAAIAHLFAEAEGNADAMAETPSGVVRKDALVDSSARPVPRPAKRPMLRRTTTTAKPASDEAVPKLNAAEDSLFESTAVTDLPLAMPAMVLDTAPVVEIDHAKLLSAIAAAGADASVARAPQPYFQANVALPAAMTHPVGSSAQKPALSRSRQRAAIVVAALVSGVIAALIVQQIVAALAHGHS